MIRILIISLLIFIPATSHAVIKGYSIALYNIQSYWNMPAKTVCTQYEFDQGTGAYSCKTTGPSNWTYQTRIRVTNSCDTTVKEEIVEAAASVVYKANPTYGVCCLSTEDEVAGACLPKCVSPLVRNPVTKQCVTCDTGRFDLTTGVCAPYCDYHNSDQGYRIVGLYAGNCVEPDCGTGETFDQENNRCVPNCQAPEELNITTGACWTPPCPEGETRDIEGVCTDENGLCPDKSYKDENGLCPENYCPSGSPRDAQGKCQEDYCADGSLKPESGECPSPPEECWDGTDKPVDGECPPDTRCGTGYTFDVELDECVKDDAGCGEGLTEDRYGNCVPPVPDCAEGLVAFNGNCREPEVTPPNSTPCPIGKYRVDGNCVTPDNGTGPGSGSNGAGTSENGTGSTGNGEGQAGDDTGEKGEGEHNGQTGFFGDQQGHVADGKTWGTEENEYDFSPIATAANKFNSTAFVAGVTQLKGLYSKLSASGSAPVFTLPFIGGNMVLDLSVFDTVAAIVKTLLSIVIIIGSIWLISKQWRAI